jgi:hypothetical protein
VATIINTLEVVVDQPGVVRAPAAAAPPKPPAPPLTPRDLEDVVERQAWTAIRLAAH